MAHLSHFDTAKNKRSHCKQLRTSGSYSNGRNSFVSIRGSFLSMAQARQHLGSLVKCTGRRQHRAFLIVINFHLEASLSAFSSSGLFQVDDTKARKGNQSNADDEACNDRRQSRELLPCRRSRRHFAGRCGYSHAFLFQHARKRWRWQLTRRRAGRSTRRRKLSRATVFETYWSVSTICGSTERTASG